MYLCNYLLCKLNLWDHTTQIIRSVWGFFLPFIGHLVLNMNASFTIKYCILLLLFQNWRRQKLIWRLWSPKLLARIMSMIACWRSMKSYRSVGPHVYWIEYGFSCYYLLLFFLRFTQIVLIVAVTVIQLKFSRFVYHELILIIINYNQTFVEEKSIFTLKFVWCNLRLQKWMLCTNMYSWNTSHHTHSMKKRDRDSFDKLNSLILTSV